MHVELRGGAFEFLGLATYGLFPRDGFIRIQQHPGALRAETQVKVGVGLDAGEVDFHQRAAFLEPCGVRLVVVEPGDQQCMVSHRLHRPNTLSKNVGFTKLSNVISGFSSWL